MIQDKITLRNIKTIANLSIEFVFPRSKILVITGKNGGGKTSIIKSFYLLSDPQIFNKSSGFDSIRDDSAIDFDLDGFDRFSFSFDKKRQVLDTRDKIPHANDVLAELPIPFGRRFKQFSLIASHDSEIRVRIASGDYKSAADLIKFLSTVYSTNRFDDLKATKIGKHTFYFLLKNQDYYVREDHLSSGEFFLIQMYRLLTSGAKLLLIDELDVALDAAAQIKLYAAIKPIIDVFQTRLIVISHSLAFINTVDDGGLYYLENIAGRITLEQRSFGYVKSDLYGFKGKDRYIITEDKTLEGFLKFLIHKHIKPFYEYEIICVGGEPQIKTIAAKNDSDQIFSSPDKLIVVVDRDIYSKIRLNSTSLLYSSPVNDIELYIWKNKNVLLTDITHPVFTHAKSDKQTAKTYWKKVISSQQKTKDEMYGLIESNFTDETMVLVEALGNHLCLS
jgi:energy-coupling factor transporter ATP-binding protein EcfA2